MVEIHAYSKAASGGRQLSAHFKVREFACGDGSDAVLVAPRLVMVLETIRAHFGAPVVIHSGYRTPQYNAKVDGVAHSQHCYGMAADISVSGQKPETVAARLGRRGRLRQEGLYPHRRPGETLRLDGLNI